MVSGRTPRRVLYVWDADYPWDVRTEKVCRALMDAGHPVAIACRNSAGRPEDELLPEGRVLRLRHWSALGRAIDRQSSFPAFFNPRWIAHIARSARLHRADLIMCRDLPLAPTAIWVGRRARLPVVLDMAENYPALIRAVWRTGREGALDFLVRNPAIITKVEQFVLPRVDHVVTVVEESSDRVERMGVPRERISCVSNTPPAARVAVPTAPRTGGPLKLTYLGLMELPRGILDVLEAVAQLRANGTSIELELIGGGRDLDAFRTRAASLGLHEPTVRFLGQIENQRALAAVATADVGLVPHHADESWNSTIPNKLFDYMAAGLPVITSDAVPAARVVRSTGAGLVYRSQNPGDLARQIMSLLDPEVRQRMSDAGRQAVRGGYNWESATEVLLDVVDTVSAPRMTR